MPSFGDVGFLSNIMGLDNTRLLELKAPKKLHLKDSTASLSRNHDPRYTDTIIGKRERERESRGVSPNPIKLSYLGSADYEPRLYDYTAYFLPEVFLETYCSIPLSCNGGRSCTRSHVVPIFYENGG